VARVSFFFAVFATFAFLRPADASIDLQQIATGIPYVVGIEQAGDGRLFLVSQGGQIRIFDGSQVLATPFLDISALVTFSGEQGLLGLAFDPNYASNGFFYVDYIDRARPQEDAGDTVIARYHVSANPNVADPNSATVVLTQAQPFQNHNGGQLRFGPDGFLYIALGDGGSGGDPNNNGQSLDTLLGKLLRIDVSSLPYTIPASNPFANTPGARGEIWAYGVRNPWRVAFDRETGDLWIADVGQNLWEEVNLQTSGFAGGANYGWRLMEATHCYNPSSNCNPGSLTLPVLEYSHSLGCSITGGFRYRGSSLPSHSGTYFFADYCSGRIWGATVASGVWHATQLLASGHVVSTFGQDGAGELYIAHYGDASSGALYKIVPAAARLTLSVATSGNGSGRIVASPASIECGSICAVELSPGTAVTLTPTPSPGSKFVGWTGDADCSDGSVTMSANRSCTAIFDLEFTDYPLAAGTLVKAVHVTELRARIDTLRADAALPPVQWTDAPLSPGSSLIRALHVSQMRSALDDVYVARIVTPPVYTDPALGAGMTIRAVHISELRQAVVALE
jgi:glucose/arabinose dehydrogenase